MGACFVLHDDLSRLYTTMSQGAVLVIMGAILSTLTSLPLLAHLYLAVQMGACFVLHDDLSRLYTTMSQGAVLVIMGAILSTLTSLPLLAHLYLAVQVAACFVLHDDLSRLYPTMSQGAVLVIMSAILSTLTSVSLHYDHSPLALPMEILRCSIGLALVMVTGGWKAGTLSATALSVWLGSSFAIAVAKSFVASGAKEKEA